MKSRYHYFLAHASCPKCKKIFTKTTESALDRAYIKIHGKCVDCFSVQIERKYCYGRTKNHSS